MAEPEEAAGRPTEPEVVEAVLATWKLLIDDGRMQDGDEYLKATGKPTVALVSAETLVRLGVAGGTRVTMRTARGSAGFPVEVADLPDGVVWAPANSGGVSLLRDLGAGAGAVVRLEGAALSSSNGAEQ